MINSKSEVISIERDALNGNYSLGNSNYIVCSSSDSLAEAEAINLIKVVNLSTDSEELIKLLPKWFIDRTPSFSKEESERLIKDTPREQWGSLPWDLGSWVDAILEREWSFVGVLHVDNLTQWHLFVYGFPANLEAFDYILKASGFTEIGFI